MANPIFSTREMAAIFWLVVFCIYILINKEIRKSAYRVIIALGNKYVVFAILSLFVYTSLITYFPLYVCGAWDGSMIKDTCIWVLFTALNILFNVNKARDFTFFKRMIIDNIKVIIILELLFNFYTFPLVVELIMLPILTFLIIVQTYAEIHQQQEPKYKVTTSYIKKIFSLIGYGIFVYIIWMTIKDYGNLLSIYNVKILLLPIVLTLLSIPYFYIVALIIEYDSVLTSIKHIRRYDNPSVAKDMIKATKRYANINLKSLSRIWKYHALYDPAKDSVSDYIKRVLQKPHFTLGHTARLLIFNDIKTVIKRLSKNGIGEFGDWICFDGDEYFAITDYFLLGNNLHISNNLVYYITGKKDYIERIELALNINYQQDRDISMAKFMNVTLLTCKSLGIICPRNLMDAIDRLSDYRMESDTYSMELQCVQSGNVETWTFAIITRLLNDM